MNHANRNYSETIRRLELDLIIEEFDSSAHVLEIGGGSGFHAEIITSHVEKCVSIDVSRYPVPKYPVQLYDGVTIPFDDMSFDIIFSSSVLEHVKDLEGLLYECARVLKPNGVMYHIVPSPVWRIWTSLTYYPALPKVILGNLRNMQSMIFPASGPSSLKIENLSKNIRVEHGIRQKLQFISVSFQQIKFKWIRSILLSPRHGERGNELSETLYFRAQWWRAMFAENGWKVEEERPSGLFYSGNALFGHALPLQARRRLAQLLGSSTRLFKVVKLQR